MGVVIGVGSSSEVGSNSSAVDRAISSVVVSSGTVSNTALRLPQCSHCILWTCSRRRKLKSELLGLTQGSGLVLP